ncbi:MAG: GAF domain-containing protein [Chloroflexi bacterium]|nr:GAF domain-containing protein [Chloroflexota bacterium]
MRFLSNLTLQQRIGLLVFLGLALGLGLFSWLGLQSMSDSTQRILEERLTMARTVASHLDETLNHLLIHIRGNADFHGKLPAPAEFRERALSLRMVLAESGIATTGVYLLDRTGLVLQVESEHPEALGVVFPKFGDIASSLEERGASISSMIELPTVGTPEVFATVPVFDASGQMIGALSVAIDIGQSAIGGFIKPITLGETGYTELVDSNGVVMARTEPERPPQALETTDRAEHFANLVAQHTAAVRTCYRCHGPASSPQRRKDVLAFAPLERAPWGIAVRQSEEEAFALIAQLRLRLILLGGIVVASVFLMIWLVMQGVVRPIKVLTAASVRVAAGSFDAVPRLRRRDEIGQLSNAFANMAQDLAKVQKELVARNQELLALNSVATAVSQSLELEEVLGMALEKVLEVTGDEAGGIFIADEGSKRLRLASWAGYPDLFQCPQAGVAEATCACHQVLSLGHPQVVNDISQCPVLREKVEALGREVCFACVPIRSKEKALGVMNVACSGGASFTEVEFRLLDSIGRQVGLAVENSLLYRETKKEEEIRGQLLNAIISAQEEERRRLSRELHDGAGQALTGLIMGIESAENIASPSETQIRNKLAHARIIAVGLLEDLRRLMQDLRSTILDDLGLVAAIRSYTQAHLEAAGVAVDFQAEGFSHRLPPPVETALFRIAQESVHNIVKHAGARTARIRLQLEGNKVRIAVEDDGRGFDVDAFFGSDGRQRSLGLVGMQERATFMGGIFHISSKVGQGTRVAVEVPIEVSAGVRGS